MGKTQISRFHLVKGGRYHDVTEQGPISRMGLWENFRPLSKKQIACLFVPKLILLSVILFYMLSR